MRKLLVKKEEIDKICSGFFREDINSFVLKSDYKKGEINFAKSVIERCMTSFLEFNGFFRCNYKETLGDIINLSRIFRHDTKEYEMFLKYFCKNEDISKNMNYDKITYNQKEILSKLNEMNLNEYLIKNDYKDCGYSSMLIILKIMYIILSKNIKFRIDIIYVSYDIGDDMFSICFVNDEKYKGNVDIVKWLPKNHLNDIYMIDKYELPGLDEISLLELATAKVIEKKYYNQESNFSIAPSIIIKQYLSLIEHEIKEIVKLYNKNNNINIKVDLYMWKDLKEYIKNNNIKLYRNTIDLNTIMNKMHKLRNKSMHGNIITKDDYLYFKEYVNDTLFSSISDTKMIMKNKKISPTILELSEIFE